MANLKRKGNLLQGDGKISGLKRRQKTRHEKGRSQAASRDSGISLLKGITWQPFPGTGAGMSHVQTYSFCHAAHSLYPKERTWVTQLPFGEKKNGFPRLTVPLSYIKWYGGNVAERKPVLVSRQEGTGVTKPTGNTAVCHFDVCE